MGGWCLKGRFCIENMKLHILFEGNMFFTFFLDYGKMMEDF